MKFDVKQQAPVTDIIKQSKIQNEHPAKSVQLGKSDHPAQHSQSAVEKQPPSKEQPGQSVPQAQQLNQQQQAHPNFDALKGKWQQQVGAAKIAWGKLTNDELVKSAGEHQKLSGLVQERYAISRATADEQVTNFLAHGKL